MGNLSFTMDHLTGSWISQLVQHCLSPWTWCSIHIQSQWRFGERRLVFFITTPPPNSVADVPLKWVQCSVCSSVIYLILIILFWSFWRKNQLRTCDGCWDMTKKHTCFLQEIRLWTCTTFCMQNFCMTCGQKICNISRTTQLFWTEQTPFGS